MSKDAETLSVYDAKAADYAKLVGSDDEHESLQGFVADMPTGAHVLDLGCGPGLYAASMVRKGCTVDAIDGSAEMVALAAARDGVSARQGFFEDIDAEDTYDGVWANFSLLHAARADLPAHLARLKRALKDGGIFHIGMKLGDSEARDGLGRRYTYVTQEELLDLLKSAGLTPYHTTLGEDLGLDGTMAKFILVRAHG